MAEREHKHSSKPRHKRDQDDPEHKHKRKHKSDKDASSSSRKRTRKDEGANTRIVDDDADDDDMWFEKNIDMDGERVRRACPPTPAFLMVFTVIASSNRHTNCGQSISHLACGHRRR